MEKKAEKMAELSQTFVYNYLLRKMGLEIIIFKAK